MKHKQRKFKQQQRKAKKTDHVRDWKLDQIKVKKVIVRGKRSSEDPGKKMLKDSSTFAQ